MPNRERRKGLEYEREVAAVWRKHGADVQDLQHNVRGLFDQVVFYLNGTMLLADPKRHETLRIPHWINQAEENFAAYRSRRFPHGAGEAPITWVIPFRQSANRWHPAKSYAVTPLEDLARLLA
jgi:hypothetical protein